MACDTVYKKMYFSTNVKAYAGYNGAKSISDTSVEFRRAKRVVTTSQWLDSASSRPRNFALVQFDQPFTDVTPFQYIEILASGDLHLDIVGYSAGLKDPETGERGGKMYELFEQAKYDITADLDRMLAHCIDSEGGKYNNLDTLCGKSIDIQLR
jgi:hypothetical protein